MDAAFSQTHAVSPSPLCIHLASELHVHPCSMLSTCHSTSLHKGCAGHRHTNYAFSPAPPPAPQISRYEGAVPRSLLHGRDRPSSPPTHPPRPIMQTHSNHMRCTGCAVACACPPPVHHPPPPVPQPQPIRHDRRTALPWQSRTMVGLPGPIVYSNPTYSGQIPG